MPGIKRAMPYSSLREIAKHLKLMKRLRLKRHYDALEAFEKVTRINPKCEVFKNGPMPMISLKNIRISEISMAILPLLLP